MKVLQIAINDLRLFMVNRGNLIGLLAIPVGMTIILGIFIPSGDGPSRIRVDLIDHDSGEVAAQFLQSLRQANSSIVLCPLDNDAEDFCQLEGAPTLGSEQALERVREGDSLALIEIPAGFSEQVRAFETVQIRYVSLENFSAPSYIRQAVEAALTRVNGAVVASRIGSAILPSPFTEDGFAKRVYGRASNLWNESPARVEFVLSAGETDDPSGGPDLGGFRQSVPGMGTMFALFTVLGGMGTLVGEKKQWTLQRLATMPVSRAQLLGGKILSRFSLGALQYSVVFAIGIVAGLNFGQDLVALVLVILTFTLTCTALSFALGSFLKNEQQAAGMTNLLGLTLAPLGGAWWPLELVPPFMRAVGHVSPVAWAMDSYTSLMFRNGELQDVLVPLLVLAGMSAALFAFGIKRFRYEL
ncbi:MAG: ABC transporter permease [Anaerolineales bacterium]